MSSIPTGLHNDWGRGSVPAHTRYVSTSSAMSVDQEFAAEDSELNGSESEMAGGISDNEEGDHAERASIPPGKMPRPEDRYRFLGKQPSSAKVVEKVSNSDHDGKIWYR